MKKNYGHNGGPSLDEEREKPGNWFAVSRDIFDHPIVGIHDRSFTETEAWLYLLSIAAYAPTEKVNKGAMIVLDPGQIMAAHAYLASRWSWSSDKVRWFLKTLEKQAMITRFVANSDARNNPKQHTNQNPIQNTTQHTNRNTNQIQIITICNYSLYQYVQTQLHQATHQPLPQPQPQATHQPEPQESNTKTLEQDNNPPSPLASKAKRSRGERLPEDWYLSRELGQWALDNFHVTTDQVRQAAEDFKLHWLSAPDAKARKTDWKATWKKWCGSPIQGWRRKVSLNGHAPDLINGHHAMPDVGEIEYARQLEAARLMAVGGEDEP